LHAEEETINKVYPERNLIISIFLHFWCNGINYPFLAWANYLQKTGSTSCSNDLEIQKTRERLAICLCWAATKHIAPVHQVHSLVCV